MQKTKTLKLPKIPLWIFILCMMVSNVAYAQSSMISGVVTDQKSLTPLTGATVMIKGTNRATVTNSTGRFTIEAAPDNVLVITFVGHVSKEVKIGNVKELNIQLEEDFNKLEEVVVIGYGTQKKKLVTGANLQVKGEDLQKQNTTSALQALQGQAPGVQITSFSGQPGSGMNVVIRGKGTIANYSPMYVVDGIQGVDISTINPADIESVDVLKDAASAAIYGAQGANGVILITTRTGRPNQKPQITFDTYYGVQNITRKFPLLNSQEYATIMNEAAINSGKLPYFTNDSISKLPISTNWLDQMFVKNALTKNYVVGMQGGGGTSVYSTSLGYTGQEGVVGGKDLSHYERYTFKMNSEHGLYQSFLKLGQHFTFNYQNNNGIGVGNQYNNTLRSAFTVSPFVPMYDSLGNFWNNSGSSWNNGESNPYAGMYYNNQNRNNNQGLFGDIYVVLQPIKGLRFRSSLGFTYNSYEGRGYKPAYKLSIYSFNDTSTVNQSMGKSKGIQFDNLLTYDFKLKEHSFSVMAGTSARKNDGSGMYGYNKYLVFDDLNHAWLTNAQNQRGTPYMGVSGSPWESSQLSYFGRLQYNFQEKYLFNATYRIDGSSNFYKGRWAHFPSVSAGWIASRETFLENVQWLNFLKVRASWGQAGNSSISADNYFAPIVFTNAGYNFGNQEGQSTSGAYGSRLGNPDIKWETSQQTNIGFDATVKKNLNINFDFYIKDTKDWLVVAPILATAGTGAPFINGGNVRNAGVELALSYRNAIGKLTYSVGVNGAYNKNKIGEIPTQDGIIHGQTNRLFANSGEFYRAQNSFPVGYFWGLKTNGVFQTEQEVNTYTNKTGKLIQPDAQPGDLKYIDLNDDGVIDNLDRTMIGDPNPDYTFGFNISLEYKGFDLAILASGVAGNQIVQSYRNPGLRENYATSILDRWHGPGSSNKIPRVTEDGRNWTQFSDLYIQNGDFLRISTITIGYDFSKLLKKNYLSKVRLYASVLNAFTFTKYDGMDPEIGYGEEFSSGTDLGYYPRPRTIMVGANIRF